MKFRTLIATGTVAITLMTVAGLAYAAESQTPVVSPEIASDAVVTTTTADAAPNLETITMDELTSLKIKEQQPTTGTLAKIFIRFRIRQLENQLNIKKALK